jgi:hypothetical protein
MTIDQHLRANLFTRSSILLAKSPEEISEGLAMMGICMWRALTVDGVGKRIWRGSPGIGLPFNWSESTTCTEPKVCCCVVGSCVINLPISPSRCFLHLVKQPLFRHASWLSRHWTPARPPRIAYNQSYSSSTPYPLWVDDPSSWVHCG